MNLQSSGSQTTTFQVDADNPYLGLASFEEEHQEFFYGRDQAIQSLLRLVRRDVLTVLFGVSGLGKTSLLQAGLFPLLRQQQMLPVWIRLSFSPQAPDPETQVKRMSNRPCNSIAWIPRRRNPMRPFGNTFTACLSGVSATDY